MSAPRSLSARLVGLACGALVLVGGVVEEARADVASWMFVGAGWSRVQDTAVGEGSDYPAVLVDVGLGTSPAAPLVIGGVLHGSGHIGFGSDWGGALRLTTGGYSRGHWGLGLDVGAQYRFGERPGAVGSTRLLLGGPWGLGVSAGAAYGPEDVATFTVVLGVDFARLTVHRTSGTNWLPNPHPSPRPEDMGRAPRPGLE